MTILIDASCFAAPASSARSLFWKQLIPRLVKLLSDEKIYLLSRGGDKTFADLQGVQPLHAPAPDVDAAREGRNLAALCRELGADLFIATGNTTAAPAAPSVFLLAEAFPFIGQIDAAGLLARQKAIESAAMCVVFSGEGEKYLASGYGVTPQRLRRMELQSPEGASEADWDRIAAEFASTVREAKSLPAEPAVAPPALPVHFFTIVLNGQPYIRHHLEQFKKLPFDWHWHVIEGVADLKNDTAWSLRTGGHVPKKLHRFGRSIDGTTQYLDELASEMPHRVTVHRKQAGQLWQGKLEMVNAPIPRIAEAGSEALLWQIDADELWTAEQIIAGRQMFLDQPEKTAARYWCRFFVGPNLAVTTRSTYGNAAREWLRTWRYRRGMQWMAHEPPVLAEPIGNNQARDVAVVNPFTQADAESKGLVFDHFAYARREQVSFKESYYGYADAVAKWEALQGASLPAKLRDYFHWVTDEAMVDRMEPSIAPPAEMETPAGTQDQPVRKLLYLRTDSIGDHVVAAGMLPAIAKAYPEAQITAICQAHLKELYEHCPQVANVITYDKQRFYADDAYRQEVLRPIRELQADLLVSTVYSREAASDFLASQSGAKQRIAHGGDATNIDPQQRAAGDSAYTVLFHSEGRKPEMQRHLDFLNSLGIEETKIEPAIWTSDEDASFAEKMFAEHGLDPAKTIALFAGGQFAVRDYDGFGKALMGLCRERGLRVLALGSPREQALNRRNLDDLGRDVGVDLTGKTTIRQAAEIVRRCRLAVGAETSLAHIACAVGTRNVVLLGGGHFGRFMPYSPLTTVACLPIECYGCNWVCRYQRPYCVRDVSPMVIEKAIRLALDEEPAEGKPRVVAEDRSLWKPPQGGPLWSWPNALLERGSVEYITVGQRGDGGTVVETKLRTPRRHTWNWPSSPAHQQRLAAARECLQAPPQALANIFAKQARVFIQDTGLVDLPASPDERMIVDEILSGLGRGEKDLYAVNYRAVAMMYFRMHELPAFDASRIPAWLLDDFVGWSVMAPGIFYEIGEKDEYVRRIEAWFAFVKEQIRVAKNHPMTQRLTELMSLRPNLIPSYFSAVDLKPLMSTRADILETYVSNLSLDFQCEPWREGEKMRVGFLKNHWAPGTETYATLPLFEHLPRDRFDVTLYALEQTGYPAEQYCKSKAGRMVFLPQELTQQVELIRREKPHFLFWAINMTAVTHNFVPLAMFRLAGVQATSICSPATSGMAKMDVFLAGELSENRPDAQKEYREKLVKLPGSGICFDYTQRPPPSAYAISREILKIDPSKIVLTSGANFYKVIPELRRTWVRMLEAAPNTVLMLYPFGPAWTNSYPAGSFVRCFNDELAAAGVEASRLVLLQPMDSPNDVQKVMAITDIYVDSFPYTGATSLMDPLEAGVPPITMAGDRLRFGQGDALMRELGMPELIATSEENYIEKVAELAGNRDLLDARRATVREKMSQRPPFLDTERFCANAAKVIEELVRSAAK